MIKFCIVGKTPIKLPYIQGNKEVSISAQKRTYFILRRIRFSGEKNQDFQDICLPLVPGNFLVQIGQDHIFSSFSLCVNWLLWVIFWWNSTVSFDLKNNPQSSQIKSADSGWAVETWPTSFEWGVPPIGVFNFVKGKKNSKWFFQADVSSKKQILLYYLFLFVFWRKLKTPKRHFEINWPLILKKMNQIFVLQLFNTHCYFKTF